MNTNDQSVAEQLAEFAADLEFKAIPTNVTERSKALILDAFGLGLASNAYPFANPSIAGALALGGPGECTVIGRHERLTVRDAAMVNGILIHGLDFDDTHIESIVHVTAACLPCAFSLSDSIGASGEQMLTAYVAGAEAAIRFGLAIKGGFHHVGFHATGVIAHFSSAIVAAKLLELPVQDIVAAQGIAASTASGVQVFLEEGAWTKRLHPGWAAVAGITAARLAEAKFVAPTRPHEGKFGVIQTHLQEHGKDVDPNDMAAELGKKWHVADVAVKPYPVCHFIHGCADAAMMLHKEIDPAEIVQIDAYLPEPTLHIIAEPAEAKQNARTEYEVKFSAQFVIATCLLKGHFGLAELQPEAIAEPATRELAKKVQCHADPDTAFPTYFSGGLTITLHDGSQVHRHVRVNLGAGERAMSVDEIVEKFMASAELCVTHAKAETIRDAVLTLETLKAGELAKILAAD